MRKFALVFLSFAASLSLAWDNTGHKVTTQIAWEKLTPIARTRVIQLLSATPEDSHILTLLPVDSRTRGARDEEFFRTVSTWADLIKSETFPNRKKVYDKGNWHYTNTFFRQVDGKPVLVPELKPQAENVEERMIHFSKVIADPAATPSDKGLAIAWLTHLIGDAHNPVHTCARVTETEPEGDQGANLFRLTAQGGPRTGPGNLHAYWDGALNWGYPRENDVADSVYTKDLATKLTAAHPATSFFAEMKPGDYTAWVKEGFEIASNFVYPPDLKRGEQPGATYRSFVLTTSEKRLVLSGYRMAELFNKVFTQ